MKPFFVAFLAFPLGFKARIIPLGFKNLHNIPTASPQSLGLGQTNTSFPCSTNLVLSIILSPHPPDKCIGRSGYFSNQGAAYKKRKGDF